MLEEYSNKLLYDKQKSCFCYIPFEPLESFDYHVKWPYYATNCVVLYEHAIEFESFFNHAQYKRRYKKVNNIREKNAEFFLKRLNLQNVNYCSYLNRKVGDLIQANELNYILTDIKILEYKPDGKEPERLCYYTFFCLKNNIFCGACHIE